MTVDGWDGRGLPPVAKARIERASADGVRTSLLSADGLAGLEVAGFEAVGEVLGTTVMQIGWSGWGGCGWQPGWGGGPRSGFYGGPRLGEPTSMVRQTRFSGYEPWARAIRHGRDTALGRMRQEATALGADGVVGVRLTEERMEGQKHEFMALGTAVRSRGRQRPERTFTTDLAAQDLAKLLGAGWVPAGIVYGLSVAVRHDDWRTNTALSPFAGNIEVTGYTELITHVRAAARDDFARQAAALGADAALMSALRSRMWKVEAGENHTDHAAECIVTGNAIAKFKTGRKSTPSLTILPLRSMR
ncbi:heavy metal-binding domain-containing protein [Actinoplanes subtropicus]|uniref:heavy metal-binding domain-containing protein n=1 Tax=Actinoplanes subtropicus TaxID=543632 RepID=UPI000A067081|nr:heavy metal-binding domain-containing protein [Actinoplanes subtropicus]